MQPFLLLLLLLISVNAYSFNSKKIISDFFSPELTANYQVSPDGNFISYLEYDGYVKHYKVRDLSSGKEYEISSGNRFDDYRGQSYYWIDNDNILVEYYSRSKREFKINNVKLIKEGGEVAFTESKLAEEFFVYDPLPEIEDVVVLAKVTEDGRNLFKVNINTSPIYKKLRSSNRINRNMENAYNWLLDKNGVITTSARIENGKRIISYKSSKVKSLKDILSLDEDSSLMPISFNDSENSLLVFLKDNDKNVIKKLFIDSGQLSEPLITLNSKNVENFVLSLNRKSLLAAQSINKGEYSYEYIDLDHQELTQKISNKLSGKKVSLASYDLNEHVYMVNTLSPNDSGKYYVYDVRSDKLEFINNAYTFADKYELTDPVVLQSKSTDGLNIESYLTPSITGGKAPLVVYPHGGPFNVRDLREFDRTVHLLSQLGYAVLQVNYRGSSGFGEDFLEAGKKQWGRLIEDDIKSAVLQSFASEFVDKEKVCIYGMSYGGYSALMSIINFPELYDCAISYAGVTDLTLLHNEYSAHRIEELKQFYDDYIGTVNADFDSLLENSPVYRVNDMVRPVYLAQGMDDEVVDLEHYFRLKYVMDLLDKELETAFFPDEKHELKYTKNSIHFFYEIHTFMQKHMQ